MDKGVWPIQKLQAAKLVDMCSPVASVACYLVSADEVDGAISRQLS